MWFAALGAYEYNPWFVHLIYHLLEGTQEVSQLLEHTPFDAPPHFIRARLYHYEFTRVSGASGNHEVTDWWKREFVRDYIPMIEKGNPSLIAFVNREGWGRAHQSIGSDAIYEIISSLSSKYPLLLLLYSFFVAHTILYMFFPKENCKK
jgi:hypothetical protein